MSAIFSVNCQSLMDEERCQAALTKLDTTRRLKAQRLISTQKRAQCVAAGLLTSHILHCYEVAYDAQGRPFVVGNPALHISITHTENWVFCALADAPIGIDAEAITAFRKSVAERLFSPREQSVALQDTAFTRIWTDKEAYYKMRGYLPLSAIKSTDFSTGNDGFDPVTKCYHRRYVFKDTILISVCTDTPESLPSHIQEVLAEDL